MKLPPGLKIPPGFQSRWTWAGPLRIHARVDRTAGPAAPAVVLVHGVGLSSRYLMPLAERLAGEFPVYALDLPGFGRSDNPGRVLDLPELAEALAVWIDAEGLGPVALLGNSFGCQVIVELAVRHPGAVDRIVLQGPTVDRHSRGALRQLIRAAANMQLEPYSQRLVVWRDWIDCGPWRAIQTGRLLLRDRMEEKLPRVQAPALVVRGTRDLLVSQRWAEEVASLLPRGRLVVLPGVTHTANYSAPLELSRVARPFLWEASRPSSAGREARIADPSKKGDRHAVHISSEVHRQF